MGGGIRLSGGFTSKTESPTIAVRMKEADGTVNIQAIYHVGFEGPGGIKPWALARGHRFTETRLDLGEPLPVPDSFDWLIVMGGPMNIYEEVEYPWLPAEKALVKAAVNAGKRVLGICLGAQLLADALGAEIYPNAVKEIGWYPVSFTPEGREWLAALGTDGKKQREAEHTVFHWHGDTFHLPQGAVRLAESAGCRNQAFRYGNRVVGLQFHLEMTEPDIERLLVHGADELTEGVYIQRAEEIREWTGSCQLQAQELLAIVLLFLEHA